MDRTQLSANFYLDEFTRSQVAARHGIYTAAPEAVSDRLQLLCERILQPLRDELGPVYICSGYRPKKLNELIGGSSRSQHMIGAAADVIVAGHSPLEVCHWISDNVTEYDQCILEFGQWSHVSIGHPGKPLREQDLTAYKHVKENRVCVLPGFDPNPYRKKAA